MSVTIYDYTRSSGGGEGLWRTFPHPYRTLWRPTG
jgi:hypothetical protein